jgi:pimeloyl-ACP methyl ester carboxylesterase
MWTKIAEVFQGRLQAAVARLNEHAGKAFQQPAAFPMLSITNPWKWAECWDYTIDFVQRSVLFWDTLRQRGDNFLEHERLGQPPVLHFQYEVVLDARHFERPVNYALVRIIPPPDVTVDPNRRPYVIIDPRAGHGPGIGGFKDDSEVGVALRDGHPVYFVIFFPEPEPGQTLLDVCKAEAAFVRRVSELHPNSAKPVLIGNCQGGWAAMMLAASIPNETGPIVITGAPLSYWGGAWRDGDGDNPMRYAGGLLGGTWLASLAGDLGAGKFDGAHLVSNMENLNPANTFWDKYYKLFANVDSEAPRFLDFERWWGGYCMMNREEIDWITQNLFVGNRLWKTEGGPPGFFDLREIKVPIILFASLGDNISPPQQAFNWVADVYGSTDEIKARGQTIVGLLHKDVGHLGIFVSGKVVKKEHTQIISVLKSIEALRPGLYGMEIIERKGPAGEPEYTVEFVEHRLEDIAATLNRFQRMDERAFEAVAMVSEFNQRAYDLFGSPAFKGMANPEFARWQRQFHPLRMQRWVWSSLNPALNWLSSAAEFTRLHRRLAPSDHPLRQTERSGSDVVSAWLDFYRDMRDTINEASFFGVYGSLYQFCFADKLGKEFPEAGSDCRRPVGANETPAMVKELIAAIDRGGYTEAVARTDALIAQHGKPLPLSRVELQNELIRQYGDHLPELPLHAARRVRGEQDLIATYAPQAAIDTLPKLLADADDRRRFLALLDILVADPRVQADITSEQMETLQQIRRRLVPTAIDAEEICAGCTRTDDARMGTRGGES